MAEQQLVDYIKKARAAGQADDLTKSLLAKNGWAKIEVDEAILSLDQASQIVNEVNVKAEEQPQVKVETQPQTQPQISAEPSAQPQSQPQASVQQQSQYKPQTQPQAQIRPTDEIKYPQRSFLGIKIAIAAIILIVLSVVGYFVAGMYINLPWNPFKAELTPEIVISKMMQNLQTIKSSQSTITGQIEIMDENNSSMGKISFNGATKSDLGKTLASTTFSANTILAEMGNISVPLIDAEVRVIKDDMYFIINETMIPLEAGINVSDIKKQWFTINQETIESLQSLDPQLAASYEIYKGNNGEFAKKINDAILSANLLSFNRELEPSAIGGQETYHYMLTVNKDKLKDLFNKIIDIQLNEVGGAENDAMNSALVKNVAQAFLTTVTDAIGNIDIETWIGKKDFMIYGMKIDKTINTKDIYPDFNVKVAIKLNISNSAFNQPVVVQAPTEIKDITTILLPLIKKQQIQSLLYDVYQIGLDIYSTPKNYYALCQKGYLNGYNAAHGQQLVDIANSIKANDGKNPACFAGVMGYCISTELTDGTYLCIDESGAVGNVKCVSSTTVCNPAPSM